MAMSVTYTVVRGRVRAENRNGVRKAYVADSLGSTIALRGSGGVITDTMEYWPYGEMRSRTGSTPTPFLHVGTEGYYTDATGNVYVRARVEQPKTTRWMSVDPLWPWQSAYGYAKSRPTCLVDTTGTADDQWRWSWGRFEHEDRAPISAAIGKIPGDQPNYTGGPESWLDCLSCKGTSFMTNLQGIGENLDGKWRESTRLFEITVEDPGVWPNKCNDSGVCAYTYVTNKPPRIFVCRRALTNPKRCGPLHCIIAHEMIHAVGARHTKDTKADAAIYNCVQRIPGCENYTPSNVRDDFD